MHINKNSGAPAGKVALEQQQTKAVLEKNVQAAKTQPAQTKNSVQAAIPRSVTSLITSAGLPADKLSASIISFARFFSLPIKPELMADIRRQAFSQQAAVQTTTETPQSESSKTSRSSRLAHAAAAAESKGAELQPKGLELYAETIDPDWHNRHDSDGQKKHNKNQNEKKMKMSF